MTFNLKGAAGRAETKASDVTVITFSIKGTAMPPLQVQHQHLIMFGAGAADCDAPVFGFLLRGKV